MAETALCPKCGMEAEGNFEIGQLFGFRVDRDRQTYPQSWCKQCRRTNGPGAPKLVMHLQRRGVLRPGQIGWLHAETCWCQDIPPDRPIWSAEARQHFRWSADPDSTFD